MEPLKILCAYLLDLAFGDPHWLPHPVRIIGRAINFLEEKLRIGRSEASLRIRGLLLTVIIVGGSAFITYVLLVASKRINAIFGIIVWTFLAYTALALGDLSLHARNVMEKIRNNDMDGARQDLSFMVGRDTKNLSEEKIITATVESIAENTNDGIVAPLFYLFLGGPVLAIAYKAVNTLDSMVGYKNERYMHFGWFSARLDDVVNFIPARISGLLICLASLIRAENSKWAFKIMLRDGRNHPSPNSGVSEAAMAGALGMRLGGPSTYGGIRLDKPYIGESMAPVRSILIPEALKISTLASFLMLIMGVCLRCLI